MLLSIYFHFQDFPNVQHLQNLHKFPNNNGLITIDNRWAHMNINYLSYLLRVLFI